jgi:hypothetical protein
MHNRSLAGKCRTSMGLWRESKEFPYCSQRTVVASFCSSFLFLQEVLLVRCSVADWEGSPCPTACPQGRSRKRGTDGMPLFLVTWPRQPITQSLPLWPANDRGHFVGQSPFTQPLFPPGNLNPGRNNACLQAAKILLQLLSRSSEW